MNAITHTLSVAWKEIQLILKDRSSLAIFLLLPLLLGVMMGGANLAAVDEEEAAILQHVNLVNNDPGAFGDEISRAIQSIEELDVTLYDSAADAQERVAQGEAAAAILIPAELTQKINAHEPSTIEVVVDPGQPESASIVAGIMNQVISEVTIWGEVQYGIRMLINESDLVVEASDEQRRSIEAQTLGVVMTTLNEMRQTPTISVATEDLSGAKIEGGMEIFFALMFPGFTSMFIFMNVCWSSNSLLLERETGTLRRLLAAPLPRGAIITGKMLAFMLLSCLQATLLLGVAGIFFDMPLGQSPLALVIVTLTVAFSATAMGMMIAALAKSSEQANNIGLLLGFVLAGIGGCIPVAFKMPFVRQEGLLGILANLTPQGHAINAYFKLFAEKGTVMDVLPHIAILLAASAAFLLISTRRFRFR